MTIRYDLTVDWDSSPRIITVASGSVEISIQDLIDSCRTIEASSEAMDEDHLIDAAGKEFLGGDTYVGLTSTLNNAVLAFEGLTGPEWTICVIGGGNLVAVGATGSGIDPRYPTPFVTVDRASSSSATLVIPETQNEDIADAVWSHTSALATLSGIEFMSDIEGGKWHIVSNQMIFYEADNITEVARFNLFDSGGSPTMENVYKRERV